MRAPWAQARPSGYRRPGGYRRLVAALVAAVLVAGACSGASSEATDQLDELRADTVAADWEVRPGVEQVTVSGAEPGQRLTLYAATGEALTTLEADETGRAHFAYIPDDPDLPIDEAMRVGLAEGRTLRPGEYLLRDDGGRGRGGGGGGGGGGGSGRGGGGEPLASEPFTVLGRDDVPPEEHYERQELHGVDVNVLGEPVGDAEMADGFQYLEMRDGVELSAMVRFPDRGLYGDGPWPTVVEYSGYGPSNPDSEEPGSRLARSLGYATVSVNMRGTGCSGGVFDTFNPAQQADGYDVIEIVARQPWVLHGHVGMVGLSYSGISQLYTAVTRPPHLAAVTAQSVIADPWLQQWPQGIYNDGFTRQWLREREAQSAAGGTPWVQGRIDAGDTTCGDNVAEHGLGVDFEEFGRALEMRPPDAEARDLRDLVHDIEAAVFLTGAFQDEQTGPQFGTMLDDFTQARALRVGLWNGRHPDGYSTMNIGQWFEFLELYVAERVPRVPPALRGVVGDLLAQNFGFQDGELPRDRLHEEFGDDYEAALAAYEEEDPIRVVFGSGHGSNEPSEPGGTFEETFAEWPSPDAQPTTWYLTPEGRLEEDAPEGDDDVHTFAFDPEAGSTTSLEGYSTLSPTQQWRWSRFPEGRAVAYQTAPLEEDLVVAGSGVLELWVGLEGAAQGDADVQVTVSEIRADGIEYLVQNGWLRLGHRALEGQREQELELERSFRAADHEPMPDGGDLVEAWIEIPAMGHIFEEGSRLRVTISSPGRNHVTWTFEPPEGVDADTTYRVGVDGAHPSSLSLPVVDVEADPEPPTPAPCPGLRGMACREARPIENATDG